VSERTITIQVEGSDDADSGRAASALFDQICKLLPDIDIKPARSDGQAQDVEGNILLIHTAISASLTIIEAIKLWREWRRDKSLIIKLDKGHAVRVELTAKNADQDIEHAILGSTKPA
jgi:hypothetical protein